MNKEFESIKQGLIEAAAFARGDCKKAVVHEISPMDVKAIRENVGMTQQEFATAFGISVGTLWHWELGNRKPQGPVRVLLNIVAKEPQAILRVLSA